MRRVSEMRGLGLLLPSRSDPKEKSRTMRKYRYKQWMKLFVVLFSLMLGVTTYNHYAVRHYAVRPVGSNPSTVGPWRVPPNPLVTIIVPVRTQTFPLHILPQNVGSETKLGLRFEMVLVMQDDFPASEVPPELPAFVRVVYIAKTVYLSYSQMSNFGASYASEDSTMLFFLSPSHRPYGGLTLIDMVEALSSHLVRHERVGIVGCTILQRVEADHSYVVLERGLEAAFGRKLNQPAMFLRKLMNGFTPLDYRVRQPTSVVAVSPYCMMVVRDLFTVHGFQQEGGNLIEAITKGYFHQESLSQALDMVRFRITKLEGLIESLSLSNKNADVWQKAYNEVVKATAIWQVAANGASFDDSFDKPNPYGATQDQPDPTNVVSGDERILFYTKGVTEATNALKDIAQRRDVTAAEEECGWVLCFHTLQSGREVHAINVTVEIDATHFPSLYLEFFARASLPALSSSYTTTGDLSTHWTGFLREQHPIFRNKHQYLLRIVWDAYCCGCCGFSNEIVHFVNALQRLYVVNTMLETTCFCKGLAGSVEDSLEHMKLTDEQYAEQRTADDEILVFISHTDPGRYQNSLLTKRAPDYIVGRSMYEFSRIGENWVNPCNNHADEIWVPSEFVKNMFITSGVRADKVQVIPEAIDAYAFDPAVAKKIKLPLSGHRLRWNHWSSRPYHPDQESNFKFLSVFKWETRKGWEILLDAYFSEFSNEDRVSLYILTHIWLIPGIHDMHMDPNNCTFLREEVQSYALSRGFKLDGLPHYVFITEDVAEVEMSNIYASVDAFVLPTRGEGWGLPAMQAMAMGLPTISTNYGGQVDFMKAWNSFLIPLDGVQELPFIPVVVAGYGWQEAKRWANPSRAHLKEIMRTVILNPDYAKKVGRRARRYIVENYSEEAIARQVDERLKQIHNIVAHRRGSSTGSVSHA